MPQAAAGATQSFFGLNIQPLPEHQVVAPSLWPTFFGTLGTDGLATVRTDVYWRWVEPNAPGTGGHNYEWANTSGGAQSVDSLIGQLAAANLRLVAVLDMPPGWAGASGTELASSRYADFAAFAAAFATRYGPGGAFWSENPQLPYLPVSQYEIWNEANSANFWTSPPDPVAYGEVLGQVSHAIHGVDSSAQVLASIGWQSLQSYVTQLYATGVGSEIDGIGFHPYAPDAPSIIGLNEQLRSLLAGLGYPQLPIYDTEIGQPAVPAGQAGAPFAYDGPVTDVARAATQSLAGDALARSDCGVDDYLLYALAGNPTPEVNGDGSGFGVFDNVTDQPDITATAISDAQQRWQANPESGLLPLCSGGTTTAAHLLPLGVQLTRSGPDCVAATISYYGNPLEGAEIVLRTADGRVAPAGTNAYGQTQMCLQDGPVVTSFTAQAEVPNVAASQLYDCPVSLGSCVVANVGSGPGAVAPSSSVTPGAARYTLAAKVLRLAKEWARLRARLELTAGTPAPATLTVWLRGRYKRLFLTRVLLRAGRARTFTIHRHLPAGSTIVLRIPAAASLARPALAARLVAP